MSIAVAEQSQRPAAVFEIDCDALVVGLDASGGLPVLRAPAGGSAAARVGLLAAMVSCRP